MKAGIRHIFLALAALAVLFGLTANSGLHSVTGSFVEQLQKRDSILIADQLRYGFSLQDVEEGTAIALPDWSPLLKDTLTMVENWKLDTLKVRGREPSRKYDIRGYMILAPFEAGEYHLPQIALQRTVPGGAVDTLLFDEQVVNVTTLPVDTTTFEIHDIKGQIRYPVTFKELLPYILGFILLAALVAGAVMLILRRKARKLAEAHKEPAYIVALRKLDHFRGDKYWAPEKQKTYYSGLTDTLREYIAETFDIDACEMTTAEIFAALKGREHLTPELYNDTRSLFELADFVKFAKHTADEQENAHALPTAVRFVTSTYQAEMDEAAGADAVVEPVETTSRNDSLGAPNGSKGSGEYAPAGTASAGFGAPNGDKGSGEYAPRRIDEKEA